MDEFLTHVQTQLEGVLTEIVDPETEEVTTEQTLKEIEIDEGQLTDGNVTLQLPAVYYDVTDMAYSHAGENIGVADAELTVFLAFEKTDKSRWETIKKVKKQLIGTKSDSSGEIMIETIRKISHDDIFVHRLTFGFAYYDEDALTEYATLEESPDANLTVRLL